jgi:DNA-directed RNA polymerase specialized sigma24 family protein
MNTDETHAAQAFLTHHDFVKGVALKYAPWPGLVEDICQQVFLEFLAKEDRWDVSRCGCGGSGRGSNPKWCKS